MYDFFFSPENIAATIIFGLFLFVVTIYLIASTNFIAEYEKVLVFTFGRYVGGLRGPGPVFVFWPMQTMVRVSTRVSVKNIGTLEGVTKDGVSLKVSAAAYWKVKDPQSAVLNIEN